MNSSAEHRSRSIIELEELLANDSTRWFARKMLQRGLVAAIDWNEKLHPRGKDGKFIHKFGWVKWLAIDGLWHRGSVEYINPNTGQIQIREKNGFSTVFDDGKKLTSLPNPKAALNLPDLKTGSSPKGWLKVGGSSGSNLGGLFEIVDPDGDFTVSLESLKTAAKLDGLVTSELGLSSNFPNHGYVHIEGEIYASVNGILRDPISGKTVLEQTALSGTAGKTQIIFSDQKPSPKTPNIDALFKGTPHPKNKFYVKNLNSPEHAKNEVLANRLYELAGVPVPEVHMGKDGTSIASKIVDGNLTKLSSATPDQLDAIRRDYAVDAWLSNWDTVGLELDNILLADGIPTRIDAGGSLRYRAQGQPKGHLFSASVTELDSLKDPKINWQSASIFKDITPEQMADGASRVAAIHPAQIDRIVSELGFDLDLADTLVARRADLIERTGVTDPWITGTPSFEDDIASPFKDGPKTKAVLTGPVSVAETDPELEKLLSEENALEDSLKPESLTTPTPASAPNSDKFLGALTDDDFEAKGLIKYDDDISNFEAEINGSIPVLWSLPVSKLDDDHVYDHDGVYMVKKTDPVTGKPSYELAELISVYAVGADDIEVTYRNLTSGHEKYHPSNNDLDDNFKFTQDGSIAQLANHKLSDFQVPAVITAQTWMPAEATGNKRNQILKNGVAIGEVEHVPDIGGYIEYELKIYSEASLTGKPVILSKTTSPSLAMNVVVANTKPSPLHVIPKPEEAHSLKAAVKSDIDSPTSPTAKKLLDNVDAAIGQKVISTKDGKSGAIVGFPPKHPNYVYVKPDDGAPKVLRSLNTLKSNDPITEDIPAGPYAHLSTQDGKIPAIGQTVKAGKGSSQIEGKITKINPGKGWVFVQPDDSKGLWKTLGTTTVISGADSLNAPSPAVAAAAVESSKKPSTKPAATSISLNKYAGPDGQTIVQSDALKQKWLSANTKRKLTIDGYVPVIGMNVVGDDGKEYIVAKLYAPYQSTPNSVRLYSLSDKKFYTKATSKLYVDHGKELFNANGDMVPTVSSISGKFLYAVPEGSVLYKVVVPANYRNAASSTMFYYTKPGDSKLYKIYTGITWAEIADESSFKDTGKWTDGKWQAANPPAITKVAYIGDKSNDKKLVIGIESYQINDKHYPIYIEAVSTSSVDDGTALAEAKAKKLGLTIAKNEETLKMYENSGVQTPAAVDELQKAKALAITSADISTKQVKPADAPIAPSGSSTVLPVVTGETGHLDAVDSSISTANSHSVLSAALATIESKNDKSNKGLLYGVGDSIYVEDIGFRTQVIKHKDGSESLEVRFRLLPDATHNLANSLLTTGGEKGYWTGARVMNPNDLQPGDRVDVRISSSIGSLKPGNQGSGGVPNATVVGEADFVGVNTKGLEVWRVPVVTQTGVQDLFYAEKRDTPSINTYKWDPEKSVPGHNNIALSPEAQAYGWTRTSGMYAPYANSGVHVDENGAGLDTGQKKKINTSGNYLEKTSSDGVKHIINIVHTSEGGTTQNINSNGEVRIRLPIDDGGVDQEQFAKTLSRALEEAGVPIEAQKVSTPDDLKNMAVSKLYANFNPQYNKNVTNITSLDDKRVKDTLNHMSKILEEKGGLSRNVTLDDLFLHTHETGRVQVLLSPEIAKAITKSQGNTYYSHSEATHSVDNIERIIAGATSGLQSTDERWSSGIMINGMSSGTDMGLGSGDRIYMHGKTGALPNSAQYHSVQIIFNPIAIAQSTEIYANQSDAYGRRKGTNNYITMGNAHEYMYKRKIEPEQIGYVMVPEAMRNTLLERLKKRGIYKIGGRSVEDVIRSGYATVPSVNSDEFQSIGVIQPNGPNMPNLPSAPTGPVIIPISAPAAPSASVAV